MSGGAPGGDEGKGPRLVIPKIVLKLGGHGTVRSDPLLSARAEDFVRGFFPGERVASVQLSQVVKRTNQSSYRALENVFEL